MASCVFRRFRSLRSMGLKAVSGQSGQGWTRTPSTPPPEAPKPRSLRQDTVRQAAEAFRAPRGLPYSLFRLGLGTFSTYSSTRHRSPLDSWLRRSRSTPCQAAADNRLSTQQHSELCARLPGLPEGILKRPVPTMQGPPQPTQSPTHSHPFYPACLPAHLLQF